MDTVPAPFQMFQVHPQLLESGKTSTRLLRSEVLSAGVQVVANGGETNLHKHPADEEVWYILAGKARFYTVGDEVVATFHQTANQSAQRTRRIGGDQLAA